MDAKVYNNTEVQAVECKDQNEVFTKAAEMSEKGFDITRIETKKSKGIFRFFIRKKSDDNDR